jgi:hypothetical protein
MDGSGVKEVVFMRYLFGFQISTLLFSRSMRISPVVLLALFGFGLLFIADPSSNVPVSFLICELYIVAVFMVSGQS